MDIVWLVVAGAPRTGGLAGGAVLALHALWINDRRRRTEEARPTGSNRCDSPPSA